MVVVGGAGEEVRLSASGGKLYCCAGSRCCTVPFCTSAAKVVGWNGPGKVLGQETKQDESTEIQ